MVVAGMLNERQIRFAYGVAAGKPAITAYADAGYEQTAAVTAASRLLENVEVQSLVADRREQLAASEGLDASWVLRQWRQIAEADPNELIQIQRVCCRHCWGLGHQFQWTEFEYRRALDATLAAKPPKPAPEMLGGLGFNLTREPHAECPECRGEGVENVRCMDTRKLKGSARRLYAGVKKTKDGIEIKMRDQDGALKNIAQYLGMVINRGELTGPGGSPIPLANLTASDFSEEQLKAIINKSVDSSVSK